MPIYYVNKPIGYTPKQVIDELQKYRIISNQAAFSGRLDPMAKGILKIITDKDCKDHDNHLKDNKTYEWDLIVGIGTDTGDQLGMPELDSEFIKNISTKNLNKFSENIISDVITQGKRSQKYPLYSAYQLRTEKYGRNPLWWYAKNNLLEQISIPEKEIEIFNFEILNKEVISIKTLYNTVYDRIIKLRDNNNNFRQHEILEHWCNLENENFNLLKIKCKAKVSTGCYIRKLSQEICNKLNTVGFALDINRVQIGNLPQKHIINLFNSYNN